MSKQYINNKKNLEWKCDKSEHISWSAPFDRVVLSKRWCPICANNQQLDGLSIAKEHAKVRGGICLSSQYINTKTKMEWKCNNKKHDSWLSSFEHIVRRKQWCPECYKERKKN